MIDKGIYDLDYIRELQARYKTDPGLLRGCFMNLDFLRRSLR